MNIKKDYIKFVDLPDEEQKRLWEFLAKTARSRPIMDGQDCAWRSDYDEFKSGADPYACLKASNQHAEKLGQVVEKKRYKPCQMRSLTDIEKE